MKILLIDDEVEILNMLQRHLSLAGFDVTAVQTPFQALEEMDRELFNLAITDIRMPGMSGIELMRKLRQINPLMNIFIITGYANMSYVVDCLGEGAYDFFTKPFHHMDELIDAVSAGGRRAERWQNAMSALN